MIQDIVSLYRAAEMIYEETKLAELFDNNSNYDDRIFYHIYHLLDCAIQRQIPINGKNSQTLPTERIDPDILKELKLNSDKDNFSLEDKTGRTMYTNLYCNLPEIFTLIEEIKQVSHLTRNLDAVQNWINNFKREIKPKLEDQRFEDYKRFLELFDEKIDNWEKERNIRPLMEYANESCAAVSILGTMKEGEKLYYERKLNRTKKTIDFLIESSDGRLTWIDVKTIAPQWKDDEDNWERINKLRKESPRNATLYLFREGGGAAIGGVMINCRWAFIQRSKELEDKIELLEHSEYGEAYLLLCSEGLWLRHDLEDFTDFYRNGALREDDPLQNAIIRRMKDENVSFTRKITGFHYLERRQDKIYAQEFKMNVKDPVII